VGSNGHPYVLDWGTHIGGPSDDVGYQFASTRVRLVGSNIRPSIQLRTPAVPAGCEEVSSVHFRAQASGEAGGTQGVYLSAFNGIDFLDTPNVRRDVDLTTPSMTIQSPDDLLRFGYEPDGTNITDFVTKPYVIRVSTVGATKGPLDGHVSVKAFETKFICQN
jgi:hypothetical protein